MESLPDHVLEAFQQFRSVRPRPVELEVPTDLLAKRADVEVLLPKDTPRPQPDPAKVEQVTESLKKAQRPIIWVGSGVISANAAPELRRLAELLSAPVVTATTGKGAFPEDHPLSLGVGEAGGVRGDNPVVDFIQECDLVLLIGCSMPYFRTVGSGLRLPTNLIQVDIDPSEIGKNYPASLGIVGDAKMVLQEIISQLDMVAQNQKDRYLKDVANLKDKTYQSLTRQFPNELKTMEGIRSVIDRDAIIVGDATVPIYRSSRCLQVYEPRTYFGPHAWSGLGFGFPAGLGAKIGCPNRQVLIITGDGGFQYNIQELGTAVQHGINPVILVFNDNAWGVLKGIQRDKFNGRFMGTTLHNPDFVRLADAYGVPATRVHTRDQLITTLGEALGSNQIHLIVAEMPNGFDSFT